MHINMDDESQSSAPSSSKCAGTNEIDLHVSKLAALTTRDDHKTESLLQNALKEALLALDVEEAIDKQQDEAIFTRNVIPCIQHYQSAETYLSTAASLQGYRELHKAAIKCAEETIRTRKNEWRTRLLSKISPQRSEISCDEDLVDENEAYICEDGDDGTYSEHPEACDNLEILEGLQQTCLKQVTTQWSDVAGMEVVKESLMENFLLPLKYPALFQGIRSPATNFLLYGKPGTGKTLLAEALANESGFKFFCVTPSALLSKWTGESERIIRGLFQLAKLSRPSIIFIDEVDAFGMSRSQGDDLASRRIFTELLIQMNGLLPTDQVYMFGATNRLEDLDEALKRRFEMRIEVPLPDARSRGYIVDLLLHDLCSQLSETELRYIAEETEGYSCSDLKALCREACMRPVRETIRQLKHQDMAGAEQPPEVSVRSISVIDFQEALLTYKPAAWIQSKSSSAGNTREHMRS